MFLYCHFLLLLRFGGEVWCVDRKSTGAKSFDTYKKKKNHKDSRNTYKSYKVLM